MNTGKRFYRKQSPKNNAKSSRKAAKGLALSFLGVYACLVSTSAIVLSHQSTPLNGGEAVDQGRAVPESGNIPAGANEANGSPYYPKYPIFMPDGVAPGRNSRTNIFSHDDGHGAQATVIMNNDNPALDVLPGFENVLAGFNIFTGLPTKPMVQYTMVEKFSTGKSAMQSLESEDFFHDMITQPGSLSAMDCHFFDSYNLPLEIQVSCDSIGDATESKKIYKSAAEFKKDSSFSMGISVGGVGGVGGGAFAFSATESQLEKTFTEMNMVMTKKKLELYHLSLTGIFMTEHCDDPLPGASDTLEEKLQRCTKEVNYNLLSEDIKAAIKDDLSPLFASTLREVGDGHLISERLATERGVVPESMVWCTPIMVFDLPKKEIESDKSPIASMRRPVNLVLAGMPPSPAPESLPILPIDAKEVLRCLDASFIPRVTDKDNKWDVVDNWAKGEMKSYNGEKLSTYNIDLNTIGVFLPLTRGANGEKTDALKDIENKMAAGVKSYHSATKRSRSFLWTFGTHYVKEVAMGGLVEMKTLFEKTKKMSEHAMGLAAQASINLQYKEDTEELEQGTDTNDVATLIANRLKASGFMGSKMKAGLSKVLGKNAIAALTATKANFDKNNNFQAGGEYKQGTQAETAKAAESFEMHFDGGSPSFALEMDMEKWMGSVLKNPTVVARELMPISDLIRPGQPASCRRMCGKEITKHGCSCVPACLRFESVRCCFDFFDQCPALAKSTKYGNSLSTLKAMSNLGKPNSALAKAAQETEEIKRLSETPAVTETPGAAPVTGTPGAAPVTTESPAFRFLGVSTAAPEKVGTGEARQSAATELPALQAQLGAATSGTTEITAGATGEAAGSTPPAKKVPDKMNRMMGKLFGAASSQSGAIGVPDMSMEGKTMLAAMMDEMIGRTFLSQYPDYPFAGKRLFLTMQLTQMFRLAKFVTGQSAYVKFWKKKAEEAQADEAFKTCQKYRTETDIYRQLWQDLTAQTSVEAVGNMQKVDCLNKIEASRDLEVDSASALSILKEKTQAGADASVLRINADMTAHKIMAERAACFHLADSLLGSKEAICNSWDPAQATPNTLYPSKQMPFDDAEKMKAFLAQNVKLAPVFTDENYGILTNPNYGEEAKLLPFTCHNPGSGILSKSICCPSSCKNCRNLDMFKGDVQDKGYNYEKKNQIMNICKENPE